MIRTEVFLIILGAAIVTLIPRIVPLVLLSRITLPERVVRWLEFVPVAVLSALLAQAVVMPEGSPSWPPENLAMIAIIPVLLIAVRTKSLIKTVAGGVVVMALLRWVMG
ncbi:MAG: AzlD domain-containing protein [Desulfomonilia bacterium]|jgi:branched-subunit amino acid transport protein|uniref:Branched-chain amino acid transport protein (AzlD) n=1 Tax=anaerobic digester metagenome TaxID=1263854 RepID=A0A485M557_9ZZZZ|nr:AzlD domain-containing protein [Pseudomonadota bacterium]HPD22577.1 AzlD domain-containing protein [Deltaproteobacteria bacterium]HPX19342.1 AzlD domain-containing protein [Deltaproteobacteria bacterium]HRS57149.1 AzlD domain-containing protein [Desulfomonilia bacterium]HRV36783.1 AzlD domain-containing protein [Desulfomonilia bacterium]